MNPALEMAPESGNETDFGDQYFYTNPRVEIGDSRYS